MTVIYELHAPLKVHMPTKKNPKKGFILNMNNYRNANFHILNKAKNLYKELMLEQINKLPELNTVVKVKFTWFPVDARKGDVSNVCCIHDKFFMDALVEAGKLEDDNYDFIKNVSYHFGEIDRTNPRVQIEIEERNED